MAVLTGLTGSITMPGSKTYKLQNISIAGGRELFDVTSFGAEWRERVALVKDLSGEASGVLTTGSGTAADPFDFDATEGDMTIQFGSGNSITFKAVLGSVRVQGSSTGVWGLLLGWAKGSGDVTVTWA